MESNFIKERTVVRGKIIKENLSRDESKGVSKVPIENPSDKVIAFEEVVNDRLKQDLADVSKRVSDVCEIIADYLKIKSALKVFKSNPHDVRIQTNLGCNFYTQCSIEDATKVYLCIGKDYYLHMELDEALKMIVFLEKSWTQQLDQLQQKASKIKAYIKVALEALGHLYEIDRDKLTRYD